jgi:DNA-binding transcriptional MocR family regulator
MARALRTFLPQCSFQVPQGGYFIWVSLPVHMDAETIRAEAMEMTKAVGFTPGKWFSPFSAGKPHCFRVCFAFYDEKVLEEGFKRLASVLQRG